MRNATIGSGIASMFAACLACAGAAPPPLGMHWLVEYPGPVDYGLDSATRVAVAPDGSIVIAGVTTPSGIYTDLFVAKYSPSGALVWMQSWGNPGGGPDTLGDLAIHDDGSIGVVGHYFPIGSSATVMSIVKYGADGELLWSKSHAVNPGGSNQNQLQSVAFDGGGNLLAGGYTSSATTLNDAVLLRVDGANGDILWVRTFDGPAHGFDTGSFVLVDSTDAAVLVGLVSTASNDTDVGLWKCNSAGDVLWTVAHDGAGFSPGDVVFDAKLGPADSVYFVGASTVGFTGEENATITRYSSSGSLNFAATWNLPGVDRFLSLAVDSSGRAYAAGFLYDNAQYFDMLTACANAIGAIQWTKSFGEPVFGQDEARSIELDASGDPFVVGPSVRATGGNPPTENGLRFLRYAASDGSLLNQQWVNAGANHSMSDASLLTGDRLALCGTFQAEVIHATQFWLGLWGAAPDCDGNGVADVDDLAAGTLSDLNDDGVPDECAALGDLNGDGGVDGDDLGTLLGQWGACAGCPADLNGDGVVDGDDLGELLGNWG
ncbi:MAG: hypothetical protein FJ253_05085 [Phycisphaerae bacterium]|nr:hypothetical protein [Phycisphaerae bacterium]